MGTSNMFGDCNSATAPGSDFSLRVPTEAASCPWTEDWEWEGVFHVHYGPLAQNLAVPYGWGFLGHKKDHEVPPLCLLVYCCGFETNVEIDLDIYLDAKIE